MQMVDFCITVDTVRSAPHEYVCSWQVCCYHGRPTVGYSHGASIWYDVRRRNEAVEYSGVAGRWIHIFVGHWQVSFLPYIAPINAMDFRLSYTWQLEFVWLIMPCSLLFCCCKKCSGLLLLYHRGVYRRHREVKSIMFLFEFKAVSQRNNIDVVILLQ
jgi:hypothetical protein